LGQPVAHQPEQPPATWLAPASITVDLAQRLEHPPLVDALESEQLEASLLDGRTGRLAAVERDLVTALAQRASDAQLWQQVAVERPRGEQDAAHRSASSRPGA